MLVLGKKENSLAREHKIDQSRSMGCGQCPQRFDTIQAERPFHLLPQEEAKGFLFAGCVVFRGNKKSEIVKKSNYVKSGAEKSKLRKNFKHI